MSLRTGWLGGLWAAGLVLLVFSAAVAITIGPAALSVDDVYRIVGDRLGAGPSGATRLQESIVWQLRLPRVVLAAICGRERARC